MHEIYGHGGKLYDWYAYMFSSAMDPPSSSKVEQRPCIYHDMRWLSTNYWCWHGAFFFLCSIMACWLSMNVGEAMIWIRTFLLVVYWDWWQTTFSKDYNNYNEWIFPLISLFYFLACCDPSFGWCYCECIALLLHALSLYKLVVLCEFTIQKVGRILWFTQIVANISSVQRSSGARKETRILCAAGA